MQGISHKRDASWVWQGISQCKNLVSKGRVLALPLVMALALIFGRNLGSRGLMDFVQEEMLVGWTSQLLFMNLLTRSKAVGRLN